MTDSQQYFVTSMNDEKYVKPTKFDIEISKTIFDSYVKMNKKMKTIASPYQTGEMWSEIINGEKKDFYDQINSGNIQSIASVLANFFKTSAIIGLWEGGDFRHYPERGNGFYGATNRNSGFWKVLMDKPLKEVELPNVGNPWGCKIEDAIVSTAQFKLNYHAQQVYNLIGEINRPIVLEIGGGFGGIGYYLFKMGFKGVYLNFDIPETLLLSEYFLLKSMPDKKSLIFNNQDELSLDDINKYDIIHMPNFMLPYLPDLSIDLVLNTRSFSEMPFQTLEEYFSQIERICRKYIYYDNAGYKSHGFEIPANEFPIPSSFRLLTKVKSLWYNGPVLNRFVEHLYERV